MRARFGRDIVCQVCKKDDAIVIKWLDRFSYYYRCSRCHVKVKEVSRLVVCLRV